MSPKPIRLDERLLEAARADTAPEDVRARVSATLGLATATGLVAAAGSGASVAGVAKATGAKASLGGGGVSSVLGVASGAKVVAIALSLAAGGVTAAALVVTNRLPAAHAPSRVEVSAKASPDNGGTAPAQAARDRASAEQTSLEESVRAPEVSAAPAVPGQALEQAKVSGSLTSTDTRAPRRGERRASDATAQASRELRALDHAHGLLREEKTGPALAAVHAYLSLYPEGVLRPEALLLEIDALRASGASEAWRAKARTFLERYPDSPGSERLRSLTK